MGRLLDDGGSDIERRLLASAVDDEMPEDEFRALVKWGSELAAAPAVPPARSTSKLTLAKGLGLLALGAVSIGLVGYVTTRSEPRPVPTSEVAGMPDSTDTRDGVTDRPAAVPPVPPPADPIPVLSLDQLPSAPPASASSAKAATTPATETRPLAADDASFAEQMKLIDAARTEIRRDDPRGALAVLDDYARRFPDPAFKEEATVLRVSALAKAGDRAQARRIGDAFLSANPPQIYRRRVEAAVRALDEHGERP